MYTSGKMGWLEVVESDHLDVGLARVPGKETGG